MHGGYLTTSGKRFPAGAAETISNLYRVWTLNHYQAKFQGMEISTFSLVADFIAKTQTLDPLCPMPIHLSYPIPKLKRTFFIQSEKFLFIFKETKAARKVYPADSF